MDDVEIAGVDGASGLARIGRVLGAAGIGLEGGGLWSGTAHYLVSDGGRAVARLGEVGIVAQARPAVVVELDADVPGALGRMMDRLAGAGVRLHAQYSDHDNRKVLVVDGDPAVARTALVGGGHP